MLYPNKIKKKYQKNVSYANRGMILETLINDTNKYYLINDIAVVYQRPTPIAIKKTEYSGKHIKTTGFLKAKSTLDYVGLYQGKYLDFDAKSTLNKTSFPISNIHVHQINHIESVISNGGISFLIIEMNNQIYYLAGEDLISFVNNNTRKSIPYDFIEAKGYKIKMGINPKIDYIKIINQIYFKKG